jgi:hypothetical protein
VPCEVIDISTHAPQLTTINLPTMSLVTMLSENR